MIPLRTQYLYVRFVATCILFLSLMAQLFAGALVVLDYKLHTPTYARHCENKARPQLHCNGKCQMAKKLKEQQEKEDKSSNTKKEFAPLLFLGTHTTFSVSSYLVEAPLKHHAAYIIATGSGFRTDIFHPPVLG